MNESSHRPLLDSLKTNKVSVTFTKKDGSTRTMQCTQNVDWIAPDKLPKNEGAPRQKKSSAVAVFDIEKGEWRSFIPENVISYFTLK
jgi:hypothetical protein